MNKDKRKVLLISFAIFAVLLISLFVNVGSSKIVAACVLAPFAALTFFGIKKRSSPSVSKREVLMIMTLIANIIMI